MKQLTCTAPGVVQWREVPDPQIDGPDEALVRPVAVARCEIDPLLIATGPRPDGDGFALGHEATAEVVALGGAVQGLEVGQLVVPAFQMSCGRCGRCRAGHSGLCESYPVLSDYGMQPLSGTEYGGMLSDLVRVPHAEAMLHPVPPGLDPVDLASLGDNVADGYRAVAPHLEASPGADVLVVCHGNPSIALFAAQSALALGAGGVTFASDRDDVLELAAALGARAVRTDFARRADRYPLVVDCGDRGEGLVYALSSTEPEGTCQSVSGYVTDSLPVPWLKLYTLGIRFFIGRVHSASVLPQVLALVETGKVRPREVTTRVVEWDEAPGAYTEAAIKLVVRR